MSEFSPRSPDQTKASLLPVEGEGRLRLIALQRGEGRDAHGLDGRLRDAGAEPRETQREQAGQERRGEGHGNGGRAVPLKELGGAVGNGVLARGDGAPLEVAAKVAGERRGGRVAALGLLAHRHHDDVVQVARKRAPQPVGAGAARGAHLFRRNHLAPAGAA